MWIMLYQNYNFVFLKNHIGTIINWVVYFFILFKYHYIHKVSMFKTLCKLMMFQEAFCMFETSVDSVLLFSNIIFLV